MDQDRISPYLLYADAGAAMDWLCTAFGFEERERMEGPGGKVMHGEIALGPAVVMVGCPGPDYEGPAKKGYHNALIHVYVDDVGAHCERARAAGAKIESEPADQPYGDRRYEVHDPEGQAWFFAQRL